MTQDARPLGPVLAGWTAPPWPDRKDIIGRYVALEPLRADQHAALLHRAFAGHDWIWDYIPYGPFSSSAQYHRWARGVEDAKDPVFFVLKDLKTGEYGGVQSLMRIKPDAGSIELGAITIAPSMQRTPAVTEAFYLMMKYAFDLGYRRFEWKCDALNLPSRRAAQRLGLSYEGIFRQAVVVKGRNRDTAWFAGIDSEWPALDQAFQVWLSPANFDADGRQRESLADMTRLVRVTSDPALLS